MPAEQANLARYLADAVTLDGANAASVTVHNFFPERVDVDLPPYVLDRGYELPGTSMAADEFWVAVATQLRASEGTTAGFEVTWLGERLALRGDLLDGAHWILIWPEPAGRRTAIGPAGQEEVREPATIVVSLPEGTVLSADPQYLRLAGAAAPTVGRPLSESLPATWAAAAASVITDVAVGTGVVERVVATRRRPPRWLQISARRQDPGPDGQACAVISVADISPVRALAPEVFDQLVRDPLTMLLNRRAVDSMVDGDELAATSHVAAVVVGINRFQSISDLHGHQVSDRCLVEVARALTVAAGESDVISRPYGDEFVIFCGPDSPVPDVLRDWGVREIIADGRRILISLQVGLSVRERGQSLRDVIRQAEQAYSHVALRTGEAVQVWTPAIADEARQRDADESRVRELIASARLVAHFQPVVDVRTGGIRGFEALLRDTVTGLSPQLIVDTARSLGLAGELHRQIITDVLDRAPAIFRAYPGVRIAINVAREQFVSGEVVDTILAATDFGANPLCSLAIEVTEELAANIDPSMLQLQMRRCVAAGVPVMIDDFGRGETSLSLLRDLEFTAIKMDRSLLPLDDDDLSWRFVEGAVGMLRTLTTEVIAEGVETSAQSRRLLDLGVSRQQGFLFGRAEPAVSWLAHPWPVAAPS